MFDRRYDKKQGTYQVGIRQPVLQWMFEHGVYCEHAHIDHCKWKLYALDRELIELAWGDLTVMHVQRLLTRIAVADAPCLAMVVWSYLCVQGTNSGGGGGRGSVLHLVSGNHLECHRHVSDADYLHQNYAVDASGWHDSVLTKVAHFQSTTASMDALDHDLAQLRAKSLAMQTLIRKQQAALDEQVQTDRALRRQIALLGEERDRVESRGVWAAPGTV